ncbi:MAG: threonine/serine dehydratase [Acidobacteriota bacterium]
MFDVAQEVLEAETRIRPYVRKTPVELSPIIGRKFSARVSLKLETSQITGSFKLRGAMNKLLSLTPAQRSRGVVAASSGNHGVAVAHGAKTLGCPGVVFVPEDASATKVMAIQSLGAEVRQEGNDCVVSEALARRHAEEHDMAYVSPYNDPKTIGGQGTIGVELSRQLVGIDTVYVALGGGGLISGIAGYLKSLYEHLEVVACSPENSPVMHESVRAGKILDLESQPTLSDGTAGGVEKGAVTFELCRELVDRYILISEAEIRDAMRLIIGRHHVLVEGAAAVPVAGFLREEGLNLGKNVAIVLCGANVSLNTLRTIL